MFTTLFAKFYLLDLLKDVIKFNFCSHGWIRGHHGLHCEPRKDGGDYGGEVSAKIIAWKNMVEGYGEQGNR